MDDASYRAEIAAAYEGELGGEAISALLAERLHLPGARAVKLDLLRRIEVRVGAALAPIARRLGAPPVDLDRVAEVAGARALSVGSWEELIAQLGPRLAAIVVRFQALQAAARPGDEAALALLVAHEEALIAFGRLEASGDEAGALACLRQAVGQGASPSGPAE